VQAFPDTDPHLDETDDCSVAHHSAIRLAARHPRLISADVYLFDAAPHRTVMVTTCAADVPLSVPECTARNCVVRATYGLRVT
jgi:hypothetical protein